MASRWILPAILVVLATPASANSCDAFTAAFAKQAHTVHREDWTMMRDGNLELETTKIFVGGTLYFKMVGGTLTTKRWMVSAWDPNKEEAKSRQFSAKQVCHSVGTDTAEGEPLDIIAAQDTDGITTRAWISRKSGLPVKGEGQPVGGETMRWIYSYNNIKAPDTN